jgi:hypothetical protein
MWGEKKLIKQIIHYYIIYVETKIGNQIFHILYIYWEVRLEALLYMYMAQDCIVP